jgi:hypothetical protein
MPPRRGILKALPFVGVCLVAMVAPRRRHSGSMRGADAFDDLHRRSQSMNKTLKT